MTDKKITALSATTTLASTDILPVVTDPGGSPATKKITIANLRLAIPESSAYTPTWSGGGTPPAIGNGILLAHYTRIGKLVTVSIRVVAGSTTSFGNGAWSFTLPFDASSAGFATGAVYALDNGTRMYQGIAMIDASGTTVALYDGLTNMDATHPHTWAVNDDLKLTITYECG